MNEANDKKKTRERSPVYPVIGLEEAISKVKELYNNEGKNPVARDVAVKSMGYKSISGRALQILSSLWQYKLIDRSKGMVKISDDAFAIIEAPANTPDKNEAIARVALAPTVFQEIKAQYPDSLPSDENIGWFLKKKEFGSLAAKIIIQCFKETISFANIYGKDYNTDCEQDMNKLLDDHPSPVLVGAITPKTDISGSKPVIWTFPFGEKTASLGITGGKPTQEEMQSLIDILTAFKNTLPKSG